MSGGGGQTTVSQSGPPPQFVAAYQNVNNQAQQVAQTPLTQYSGSIVAPFSPDQNAGIAATENAQGIANPYINAAAQEINNSTTPVWSNAQQWSPGAISQYQSPYTQQVVNATQAQFNNQNQQQQQQVQGNAASQGALGGDRSAVAAGITAGQEQLAQAPVIANLENTGYQTAQNEFNTQQAAQIGANEANNWLSSQAGYGLSNLGNQALTSNLTGANALLGVGGLEQSQAQANLNVPYQQFLQQQAYPFQTTGWLANIAEGLGSASGGSSSTTSPGPSTGSQLLGAGVTGAGLLGQSGAFGSSGWLTGAGGLFGSGASAGASIATSDAASLLGAARGGGIPHRGFGGMLPAGSSVPTGFKPPNVDVNFVPGMGPGKGGLLSTSTGSTASTSGSGFNIGDLVGPSILAASVLSRGGIVPFPMHRARGGIVPANDDGWEPMRRRAAGGITAPPQLPGNSAVSTFQGNGGVDIPILNGSSGAPSQGAGSSSGGSYSPAGNAGIDAYLKAVQATSSTTPPAVYTPPVASTSPSTPAAATAPPAWVTADWGATGAGGGNMARGGTIQHRDDGGLVDGPAPMSADDDIPLPPPVPPPAPPMGGHRNGIVPLSDASNFPDGLNPNGPASPSGGIVPPSPHTPPPHDKSDIWNTLTNVGLGIMGGTSPHAGVNIGRGALEGLKLGNDQKFREAQQQANEAYRMGMLDVNNRKADTQADLAGARAAQLQAQASLAMARAAGQIGGHVTEGDILNGAVNNLIHSGDVNPETGKPWTQPEALMHIRGVDARVTQGNERNDIAWARLAQTADTAAGNQELRRQAMAQAKDAATARLIATAGNDDILAASRLAMTPSQFGDALAKVREGRNPSGPAAAPPAQSRPPLSQFDAQ